MADRWITLALAESYPSLLRGLADPMLVIGRGEVAEGSSEAEGTKT